MATSATNDVVSITRNSTSMPAHSLANCFSYIGPGIYIKDDDEWSLYMKWRALPHQKIHISTLIKNLVSPLHPYTPELVADVAATITPEQNNRFALHAPHRDMSYHGTAAQVQEGEFEIRSVLVAIKEDELANFDAEDFKRMEKKDESHRQLKQELQGRVNKAWGGLRMLGK